jgi:ABC-2 type transport system ATP-binding protein
VALVEARSVGRRFGARWALRGVSMAVEAGETVALVGSNGAGKTTLLTILAGALSPSEGTASVAGGRGGFVTQQVSLWRRLTPRENLRLLARVEGLDAAAAAADELIGRAGLDEFADRPVGELSVGQMQRVNVAAGLLGDPRVVLLDEPTASLDPRQRRLLWDLLAPVPAGGGAVVFTTQNVEEVALHADRMVALADGAVAFEGTAAELRRRVGAGEDEGFEAAFVRFLDSVAGQQ